MAEALVSARPLRLLLTLGLWIAACAAAAESDREHRHQAPRIVAFGDVHGAYDRLTRLLATVGIIDDELRWRGGATHLVSLGDITDRGPDSRKVMDLLRRLQGEAAPSGGRVHVVLGNHELMNLTGDLRYVSDGERASYPELGEGLDGLRAAFAPDGPYGSWLLEQPSAVVINDTVFVHGGLSSVVETLPPDTLNDTVGELLRELLELRQRLERDGLLAADMEINQAARALDDRLQIVSAEPLETRQRLAARRFIDHVGSPVLGNDGPFWYRGNARCHPLIETPALESVLGAWGAARVVVGHTPTVDHRVHARLDGRVILADTGMLESHYQGRASAVVIDGDGVSVVYGNGEAATPETDNGQLLFPLDESEVLERVEENAAMLVADGGDGQWHSASLGESGSVMVKVDRLNARERAAALAAVRLDRLLQLNLAAPATALNDGRSEAVATVLWPGALTETDRAAAGIGVSNPCTDASAVDLLYAFDALIGNNGRSADNIVYDRRTLRLGSIDHSESFGRSSRFPAYLEGAPQRLPPGLAAQLRRLEPALLEDALGDLLRERQIRSILQRRDRLLDTWPVVGR